MSERGASRNIDFPVNDDSEDECPYGGSGGTGLVGSRAVTAPDDCTSAIALADGKTGTPGTDLDDRKRFRSTSTAYDTFRRAMIRRSAESSKDAWIDVSWKIMHAVISFSLQNKGRSYRLRYLR